MYWYVATKKLILLSDTASHLLIIEDCNNQKEKLQYNWVIKDPLLA